MREIEFFGTAKKDLQSFPKAVKRQIGNDLWYVQEGRTPTSAKPMKGNHLKGVMEITQRHDTDTYRAVYVANIGGVVVVLHCFKKKSKRGRATPNKDIDLIVQRLKLARAEIKERS